MTKKKKTAAKQSKQNLQKPSGKPGKDAAAPKKNTSEPVLKKDIQSKPAQTRPSQTKEKKSGENVSKPSKPDATKAKAEQSVSKPEKKNTPLESAVSKPEPVVPKLEQRVSKTSSKTASPPKAEAKKQEETKPPQKAQIKKDARKKEKAVSEPVSAKIEPVEVQKEVPAAETSTNAPHPEPTVSVQHPIDAAPETVDPPRKVAKTLLEVEIGGLAEAAAKATGTEVKGEAPPPKERKVAKTLMEISADSLRDAVEASARAIEEEIAAALRDSDSSSEAEIAAKIETAKAQRKVPKTLLDVRAIDLTELANFAGDTLDEPDAQPEDKPRKVAKTMLEIDAPDLSKIIAASTAAPEVIETEKGGVQESDAGAMSFAAEESPVVVHRQPGTDEVSIADLSEFAQALREDKPMSAPTPREKRAMKTMMEIRRVGLASSSSLPTLNAKDMNEQSVAPEAETKPAPLRVSRSLHPLDNFSFDNLCPAEEVSESPSGCAESPSEPVSESKKRTGSVELERNLQESASSEEFKGTTTVWPTDQKPEVDAEAAVRKPERFVAKTMLDMDFLKDSLSVKVARAEERMAESIALKASEPPKPTITSDDFKLAQVGCPFVWAEGDSPKERVRYCSQCSSQIYNFAGLDLAEAKALIFKRENRENAPLYKREDGKFMTRDCPIALKKAKDKFMMIAGAVLIVLLLGAMWFLMPPPPKPVDPPPPPPSQEHKIRKHLPSGPSTTTGSPADGKGAYHYHRGDPAPTQTPPPIPQQQPEDTTIPGTTSGFDESGKFWQYDNGNN